MPAADACCCCCCCWRGADQQRNRVVCCRHCTTQQPLETSSALRQSHREALRTMSLAGSRGVAMAVTHPWWPFRLPLKLSVSAMVPCFGSFQPRNERGRVQLLQEP